MTAARAELEGRKPTRQECIEAAGAIYGSILADPDRRAVILAHRAELDAKSNTPSK